MPCLGRIAVVFQSLLEICPQILWRWDFTDEEFWLKFVQARADTCLTFTVWIVLFKIDPKNFSHRVSLKLRSLRRSWSFWVLRDAKPIVLQFSKIATALLSSLSLHLQTLFRLFTWLFFNLVVREQALVSCFASRFCYMELTFGRMPRLTRWSRASTFQEEFARLSKNGPMANFASDTSFSRHHLYLVSLMAQRVERLPVPVLVHDHHSHAGNCTGLPSNTGLFLSTGKIYLFAFQRHLCPPDAWSLYLFRCSRVWRQNFAVEVSVLYSSSPLSSFFDNWASISSDESSCREILVWFWAVQTHVFSICTELRSVLYQISRTLSLWRVTENNQRNPSLYHEHQQLKSSRRSWRRSVFLVRTRPLSGLSVPRGWPSSWSDYLGWSYSKQKQILHPTSQSLENSSSRTVHGIHLFLHLLQLGSELLNRLVICAETSSIRRSCALLISPISYRTSFRLVSNFQNIIIMKSDREQSAKSITVSWAPATQK